jgi:hypothetical protein
MYSKILLIQHAQNWTGAELLNIQDYQMVIRVLKVIFCYCSYTWAAELSK